MNSFCIGSTCAHDIILYGLALNYTEETVSETKMSIRHLKLDSKGSS